MEPPAEPVHQIDDYCILPLKGVAEFRGAPHRFCYVGWVSPPPEIASDEARAQWFLDRCDPSEIRYELVSLNGSPAEMVWARATFYEAETGSAYTALVEWHPIPVQERLRRILEAQRWGGPDGLNLGVSAYLCVWVCLNTDDLEALRPELHERDADLPRLGEIGCYNGLPVFPIGVWPIAGASRGLYQGIQFA